MTDGDARIGAEIDRLVALRAGWSRAVADVERQGGWSFDPAAMCLFFASTLADVGRRNIAELDRSIWSWVGRLSEPEGASTSTIPRVAAGRRRRQPRSTIRREGRR